MNHFLLGTKDRLRHWKEFRRSLPEMDELAKLNAVANYWSTAPLSVSYDIYDAATWPTPWEMISDNQWCDNTVAIGMENTLRLSGFPSERMTLKVIIDRDIHEIIMILSIDGKLALNYDWGMVSPYPQSNHSVLKSWKFVDKDYIQV